MWRATVTSRVAAAVVKPINLIERESERPVVPPRRPPGAAIMHDPLRALLRGCRAPPKPPSSPCAATAPPPAAAAAATPAPPSLAALLPHDAIRAALQQLALSAPTAVQAAAIPHLHSRDVLAVAPTGSGKTLCYLLPLLQHHLRRHAPPLPHSVVLAPTHELVNQIARVLHRVLRLARVRAHVRVLNSKSAVAAWNAAPSAAHFVVATPQRLVAAVNLLGCSTLRPPPDYVVLDEADELLSEKFVAQLDDALHLCGVAKRHNSRPAAPQHQQQQQQRVHMFSATMPPAADQLARTLMNDVKRVTVGAAAYGGSFAVDHAVRHIEQRFVFVGGRAEQGKVMAVRNLLRSGGARAPVLLFVQSKQRAAQLFRELLYDGVHVDALHSDRTAAARDAAVQRFREGRIWVLVATDVLSRGLDFHAVRSVINYDVPSSGSAYVHRIGRCGRNGRHGVAYCLFTEDDVPLMGAVVRVATASGAHVPQWLLSACNSRRLRADEARRLERTPPKRAAVGGPNRLSVGGARRKRRRVQRRQQQQGEQGEQGEDVHEDDAERTRAEGDSDGGEQQQH